MMKAIFVTFFVIVATREVAGKGNWSNSRDDQPFKVYVRLKGSSLPYAGRVEISMDGEHWGTICDKDWDLHDARVICRQLKFSNAVAAVPMAGFGAGSGAIFLKDVDCKGSERSLLQCEHDGWKSHNVNGSCDHSMDAGVLCSPPKQMLSLILIIVLGCVLFVSFLLNIWFTYYVCCRTRRKRKRHLSAVQQKALTHKTMSQNGLENLALDTDGVENLSTSVSQESQVLGHSGIHRARSGRSGEDAPTSNTTACQQEQHVYQRLESCVFDPPSQEYLEIIESLGHRETNQQPAMRVSVNSPKRPSYQSRSPQLQASTESKKDNKNDQVDGNLYEKLLIRNGFPDEAQTSSAAQNPSENGSTSTRTSIPDYVEIISDDVFAANAMAMLTSQESTVIVDDAYETLKPAPDPALQEDDKESACAAHIEDHQSVRGENTAEPDYMEPLNENEKKM